MCYDLSDSDSNDTDISEIADDEQPAHCSSDVASSKGLGVESSLASNSKASRIETTSQENSAHSVHCVGSSHAAAYEKTPISHDNLSVTTAEEKPSSWKDFFGSESGKIESLIDVTCFLHSTVLTMIEAAQLYVLSSTRYNSESFSKFSALLYLFVLSVVNLYRPVAILTKVGLFQLLFFLSDI